MYEFQWVHFREIFELELEIPEKFLRPLQQSLCLTVKRS